MHKKYSISRNVLINAKPEHIFRVLADIENWSLWTSSIKKIMIVNDTRLNKGTKVKIVQPKLLSAVWEITEIEKDKYFTMEKRYVGLKMIAKHILEPKNNTTSVELVMIYEGVLAKLFYSLTSSLTSQYLTMEINGLKNKCEKVSLVNREALKFFI
jgi:hypothetical protein